MMNTHLFLVILRSKFLQMHKGGFSIGNPSAIHGGAEQERFASGLAGQYLVGRKNHYSSEKRTGKAFPHAERACQENR